MIEENQKLYQLKKYWESKLKEHQKKALQQFTLFFTLLLLIAYSVNSQLEKHMETINNTPITTYIIHITVTILSLYITNKLLQSAYKNLDKKETADQKISMILSYLSLKENNQAINDRALTQEFEQNLAQI
jgi:cellobiose-specific phosphotransferase system component IIC